MRLFLTLAALIAALILPGCGKNAARSGGGNNAVNAVETFINAKANRDYASMWQCLTPRVQKQCGSFEYFKAEQEKTYELLGGSGWKALTDQMREDAAKIRTVEIDGKYYVDEK